MKASREELLISLLADRLAGDRHVAVGAASPIPGSAALLAKAESSRPMQVTVLQSRRHNHFVEGSRELFDCAAQGRIDSFFLGGVQIDGQANINLVGIGDYPRMKKRFPGSFGSALMYYVVPKVILFREEHSRRSLVEKVDFISAPGSSEEGVYRPGGPKALVTGRAVFEFDRIRRRFRLEQIHPGETKKSVEAATGFAYDLGAVTETPAPSAGRLEFLRGEIAPKVAQFYPEFAERMWGVAAQSAA